MAMLQTGRVLWSCLIGGASKWKRGQILMKQIGETRLEARFIEKRADDFVIEFFWTPESLPFISILHQMGSIPLPPYLKRPAEISDAERYQTIYARESGSVAAPTAGLHFSEPLLEKLSAAEIHQLYLTLHVGAGTFMPVKTENIAEHHMHEEYLEVSADAVETLISKIQEPVIAVGTTSLRTLETLYWLGLQVSQNKNIRSADLQLDQWFPYRQTATMPAKEALHAFTGVDKTRTTEKTDYQNAALHCAGIYIQNRTRAYHQFSPAPFHLADAGCCPGRPRMEKRLLMGVIT